MEIIRRERKYDSEVTLSQVLYTQLRRYTKEHPLYLIISKRLNSCSTTCGRVFEALNFVEYLHYIIFS